MQKERNFGIDLLRIVAMLMVVGIHCIGNFGLNEVTSDSPVQFQLSWLVSVVLYGAVDLYALITGYVCIDGKHRWGRILELWLQVFFYSVGFCLLWIVLSRDISAREWVKCFAPALTNHYWYFSSYILLFFAMPFLIRMLNTLSKQQYKILLLFCFFGICGFGWISEAFDFAPFKLSYGFSPLWLIVLFITGGYLKRYEKDFLTVKKYIYVAGWAACIFITWLSRAAISAVTEAVFQTPKFRLLFFFYISPTVVLAAIFQFLFFMQLKISRGTKFIAELSSVTFGVFLIHTHCLINRDFIAGGSINFSGKSDLVVWIMEFLMIALIYLVCSVIDYGRKLLFRWLHIPQLCQNVTNRIQKLVSRCLK